MSLAFAVSFLSPLSALVALAVALPLAAFVVGGRRADALAAALGLPPERRARRAAVVASLSAIGVLLALAAARPVVTVDRHERVRTDAEGFVVFDTSRSMLASSGYHEPDRLERAKAFAVALRARLPEVPFGIASMTDRTLPHLFPTPDATEFGATARRAVGIEQPPPEGFSRRATTMGALSAFSTQSFFADVPHRLLVVLTDGESRPFVDATIGALFRRAPSIDTVFVRFWRPGERIFLGRSVVDPLYRPDGRSEATLSRLAGVVGGSAYGETQVDAAARAVRAAIGSGPVASERPDRHRIQLAPYVALAAFLPLSLVLWRRNL